MSDDISKTHQPQPCCHANSHASYSVVQTKPSGSDVENKIRVTGNISFKQAKRKMVTFASMSRLDLLQKKKLEG